VRAYYLAAESASAVQSAPTESVPSAVETAQLNRELFQHFERVFEAATGQLPEEFAPNGNEFASAVRRLGARMEGNESIARRIARDAPEALAALQEHYSKTNFPRMAGAKALPGSKLVLGGTQSFSGSSLRAVRSMLLYCDTVLIPDPVFPYLEVDRPEEQFGHVLLLQQIFYLARLKPLVDADLPYPAVVVFPSWEKLLEANDPVTQDGQELQVMRLLSHFVGAPFEDLDEVVAFVRKRPDEFISAVSKNRLFVPPEGDGSEPFAKAVALQRESHRRWRSPEFVRRIDALSDAEVALGAIIDRLGPQFHLEENATTLNAAPLLALPQQWHYFRLLRRVETETLVEQNVVTSGTVGLIQALTQPVVQWLGNVPIKDLVVLRRDHENATFRKELDSRLGELGGADEGTLDAVTSRVVRALSTMLAEHGKDVRRITEEYKHKHLETAVASWITLATGIMPWFPVVGPVALATLGGKYIYQKASERLRFNQSRRTLMGFLAAAAADSDDD
jgi:hypothetical protein